MDNGLGFWPYLAAAVGLAMFLIFKLIDWYDGGRK